MRLARADLAREQRRPHGAGKTHLARQPIGAARVGDQPDPGEGLHEGGAFGGDDDIGGQREIGPGPGGDPVDSGDDRHRRVIDRLQKRLIFIPQRRLKVDIGRVAAIGKVLAG